MYFLSFENFNPCAQTLSRMRQPPPNPPPSSSNVQGFEDIFKKLMPNANLNFGTRSQHHQPQSQGEMLRPTYHGKFFFLKSFLPFQNR